MKHTLYAVVQIEVESDLPIEEIINEISSESYYTIDPTDNVEVLRTTWLETDTHRPFPPACA